MIIEALQKVYRKPAYIMLALSIAVFSFVLAVWFPNIDLITNVIGSEDISIVSKVALPIALLGSIATNFTLLSASYTIAIAMLFGIYIGMMTYFLKRRIREVGQSGVAPGFLGVASGVFGLGCAACGSFLVSSLSLVGASGVLTFLPLGGGEFGIIGVGLLTWAIYLTAKQIQNPSVCGI